MNIEWKQGDPKADIYEAYTNFKFWLQVAPSTSKGEFVWVIFHEDSGYAQWGGSETSIENAKTTAIKWLMENKDTWKLTNPR